MAPDASAVTIVAKDQDKQQPVPPDVWEELHGYYFEDLAVGMTAVLSRTVQGGDITAIAGISGDTNPLHLSDDFAQHSIVEGRIAHGVLTASYISALIGTRLPGPGCLYVSQSLRFKGPVRAGDTVNTRVTITRLDHEKSRVTLWCECFVGHTIILEGEAVVQVTKRNPD